MTRITSYMHVKMPCCTHMQSRQDVICKSAWKELCYRQSPSNLSRLHAECAKKNTCLGSQFLIAQHCNRPLSHFHNTHFTKKPTWKSVWKGCHNRQFTKKPTWKSVWKGCLERKGCLESLGFPDTCSFPDSLCSFPDTPVNTVHYWNPSVELNQYWVCTCRVYVE